MEKTVTISWFAILWKRLWGGKEAVFDYLLDKGNTLVAMLPADTKDTAARIYSAMKTVYEAIDRLAWIIPDKWMPYASSLMSCYAAILSALEDARVTPDELSALVAKFQSAYAVWHTEG